MYNHCKKYSHVRWHSLKQLHLFLEVTQWPLQLPHYPRKSQNGFPERHHAYVSIWSKASFWNQLWNIVQSLFILLKYFLMEEYTIYVTWATWLYARFDSLEKNKLSGISVALPCFLERKHSVSLWPAEKHSGSAGVNQISVADILTCQLFNRKKKICCLLCKWKNYQ